VFGLLEGKNVNLRVMEREDVDFLVQCFNDMNFRGEYTPIEVQISKSEEMKRFDNPSNFTERKTFIIQKKDGTRIGIIYHLIGHSIGMMEIGYFFVPSERGKGYGTEAVQLMVDYLFLSQNIVRIEATTNVGNKASQRVLEKAGFRIEGTIRKLYFVRGVWTDYYLYSILREEWKEPKIASRRKYCQRFHIRGTPTIRWTEEHN
jgi:RimJ/RimL family protein N-acetyltransferase